MAGDASGPPQGGSSEGADERQRALKAYHKQASQADRREMVERHLPLVKTVAQHVALGLPEAVDFDDLYAYGSVGLLQAIERYDPGQEASFRTFAYHHIRGAVLDGLRDMDHLPRTARRRLSRYRETVTELREELGRFPTDDEVRQAMGLSQQQYDNLLDHLGAATLTSLDEPLPGAEAEGVPAREQLAGDGPAVPETADRRTMLQELAEALESLEEQEQLVLQLLYFEDLRPKEVAETLEVSASWVRKLHNKALFKLRMQAPHLKGFL